MNHEVQENIILKNFCILTADLLQMKTLVRLSAQDWIPRHILVHITFSSRPDPALAEPAGTFSFDRPRCPHVTYQEGRKCSSPLTPRMFALSNGTITRNRA